MELTRQDTDKMVLQLQQSHRIVVAFYRRFLPLMDEIAEKLNCQFRKWTPQFTNMPSRSNRPSNAWAWDYVPLFASRYDYWYVTGDEARTEDIGISFYLYVEDSFLPENRKIPGQPDPVNMPNGAAVLRAYLFRPIENMQKSFQEIWGAIKDYPKLGNPQMQILNECLQSVVFEWPLAEVIHNEQLVIEALQPYISS